MTRYLTSVFKVMYETQPGVAEQMGVSPEELAKVTAEQAFEDADLNHDGRLSFDEFQKWYTNSENSNEDGVGRGQRPPQLTLSDIRKMSGLGKVDAEELFEHIAIHSDEDGVLNFENFTAAFVSILDEFGSMNGHSEASRVMLCKSLFEMFDTDENGVVDFSELASGLSILCRGSRDDKVRAAFSLYDANGDGFISLEEMTTYLEASLQSCTRPIQVQKIVSVCPPRSWLW